MFEKMRIYVTHTLSLTGSPRSLLALLDCENLAKDCIILSYQDGPLLGEFLKKGHNIELLKSSTKAGRFYELLKYFASNKDAEVVINSAICTASIFLSSILCKKTIVYVREYLPMMSRYAVLGWMKFLFVKMADRVVCVSNANKIWLRRYLGIEKSFVVYNGLAAKNFEYRSIERSVIQLAYIGSCDHRKGFDRLLGLYESLAKDPPCKNVQISVFGDFVDTEYKRKALASITRIQESTAGSGQVKFQLCGYVNDIMAHIEQTHCCISFARAESLPRNVMEAASLGIPVVATDVGGTSELLPPNWPYLTNDEGRLEIFVREIIQLSEPDYRALQKEIVEHSRLFSIESTHDAFLKVFDA